MSYYSSYGGYPPTDPNQQQQQQYAPQGYYPPQQQGYGNAGDFLQDFPQQNYSGYYPPQGYDPSYYHQQHQGYNAPYPQQQGGYYPPLQQTNYSQSPQLLSYSQQGYGSIPQGALPTQASYPPQAPFPAQPSHPQANPTAAPTTTLGGTPLPLYTFNRGPKLDPRLFDFLQGTNQSKGFLGAKRSGFLGITESVFLPDEAESIAALEPFEFALLHHEGVELWNASEENCISRGSARLLLRPPQNNEKWNPNSATGHCFSDFDIAGKTVLCVGGGHGGQSFTCMWNLATYVEDLSWKSQPRPSIYATQPPVPELLPSSFTSRPGDYYHQGKFLGEFAAPNKTTAVAIGRNQAGSSTFDQIHVVDLEVVLSSSSHRFAGKAPYTDTSNGKLVVDPNNGVLCWVTLNDGQVYLFDTRTLKTGPVRSFDACGQGLEANASATTLWKRKSMKEHELLISYHGYGNDTRGHVGHYVYDIRSVGTAAPSNTTPQKATPLLQLKPAPDQFYGGASIYQNVLFSIVSDGNNYNYTFFDIDNGGAVLHQVVGQNYAKDFAYSLNSKYLIGSKNPNVFGASFK
eukprot:TRINITY_DN10711_c0_g1_i2.p1 TRINITY_DN10711_c0_g1~~TRINITY_DN10711_c0_g1_i2.p1  ORF type:complete len:572 (+),score=115.22 TRINITY_DN10711_c0_g1_i2:92-1807(+)